MSAILGVAGTAGVVAGGVFAAKLSEKMAEYLYDTTLHNTLQGIKAAWDSHAPTSYIRAASPSTVSPMVMIDEAVSGLPYTRDVMGALQRIFTCNYLMAQAVQNQIGGISIAKRIDRFSPDRSLDVATRHFLSMESSTGAKLGVGPLAADSYALSLPIPGVPAGVGRYGDLAPLVPGPIVPYGYVVDTQEQEDDAIAGVLEAVSNESSDRSEGGKSDGGLTKSADAAVKENATLAIGQIVDVKIVHEDKSTTIPIHIRMRPITTSSEVVSGTFALRGKSYSMGDRLRAFRVEEIGLKDLLFQTDAVREYRKLVKQDKSGFFRKTYDRANRNFLAQIISGKASIGQMSSIILTSSDTVRSFEYATGSRLDDYNTRQGIMEDSLTMIIAVIDPNHETLTVYLDSIDDKSDYMISDLKPRGKNDGDDMSSLLNSLLEGKIPGRL